MLTLPWTVDLPLPPTQLRPNARLAQRNPAYYRRLVREYKALVYLCLRQSAGPPPYPTPARARLSLTVLWPDGRHHWDKDNLVAALKGLVDAYTAAGLIAGDDPAHLDMPAPEYVVDRALARPTLRTTLEDAGGGLVG